MKAMIALAVVVLVSLAAYTAAFAQNSFWVEERTLLTAEKVTPQLAGTVTHYFSNKIGASCYFQVGKAYAEAYLGPNFAPRPWIELNASLGLEQADNSFRYAGSLWLGNKHGYALGIWENGGSDYWYKAVAVAKANKLLAAGGMVQRFAGVGLRLEVNPVNHVVVWAAPLYEWNSRSMNYLLTLKCNF